MFKTVESQDESPTGFVSSLIDGESRTRKVGIIKAKIVFMRKLPNKSSNFPYLGPLVFLAVYEAR